MDKIIAFLMTHPYVTVEIKKDINFYQAVNITMRKNNAIYREVVRIERIADLESILVYMYDAVSSTEKCPKCGTKIEREGAER